MAVDWWALAEEEKEQLRRQARRSGEPIAEQENTDDSWWDVEIPADFSNVESAVVSDQPVVPTPNEDPGFLGNVVRMGANAYQNLVPWESDAARQLTDNPEQGLLAVKATEANRAAARATQAVQQYAADEEGMTPFRDAPAVESVMAAVTGPFAIWKNLEKAFLPQSAEDQLLQQRKSQAEVDAARYGALAQEQQEQLGGQYAPLATLSRNLGGVLAQPEQLGGIVGGLAGGALTKTPAGAAIGAGAGMTPAMRPIYNAAIAEAKDWPGITKEERHEYGMMQVAAELGPDVAFSVFGAGLSGVFSKWGPTSVATDAIRAAVQSRLSAKVGLLAAGGGTSEVIAERAGLGATELMADRVENEETRDAINKTVEEEKARGLEKYVDPFVGGVLFSAAGAPSVVGGHIQQQKQAEVAAKSLEAFLNMKAEGIQGAIDLANQISARNYEQDLTREDTELNLDIAREEERIRNEEARTRAFEQAEAERNTQRELDEEAGFQTIERGVDPTTRVDRYGGKSESVPGSPAAGRDGVVERVDIAPAREVRPEDVQAQREEAARAEAERIERVERLDRIEAIRARQEAAQKKAADAETKEQKAREKAARSRQDRITDELIAENPNATPDQLEQELKARMMVPETNPKPPKTEEQKLTEKVKQVKGRLDRAGNQRKGRDETLRVEGWLKRNPNATVEEAVSALMPEGASTTNSTPTPKNISGPLPPADPNQTTKPAPKAVAPGKPVENAPPVTKKDKDLSDAEVDELTGFFTNMVEVAAEDAASLGMADTAADLRAAGQARRGTTPAEGTTRAATAPQRIPDIDLEAFKAKTSKLVRALVNRTTRDSRSVQDMIWQGKLNVVPNAAAIGRDSDNAAEYDAGTGTMYLFADKLDNPSDAVSIIARAFHEATHAGQFNDRQGRSNLFRHFLGDPKVQKSAATIRKAAAGGNKIAKEAVRKAEADTTSRKGDNRYEDLEVVGYFTSEVVQSRGSTLGTVGGVARDITSTAREFLRDKLGMDLDITLGDLNTAAANVGTEIAQTNTRGLSSNPNVLGMIYNIDPENLSPQQRLAIDNGYVYESVDGRQKYVLSDADAEIIGEDELAVTKKPMRMSDVLKHDVLYNELPQARDIDVYPMAAIPGIPSAYGAYSPSARGLGDIYVRRDIVDGSNTDPNMPSLKEVLIHEIQHFVQDQGGYADEYYDASQTAAVLREAKEDFTKAKRSLLNKANKFISNIVEVMPTSNDMGAITSIERLPGSGILDSASRVAEVATNMPSRPPEVAPIIDEFFSQVRTFEEAQANYRKAVAAEHAKYLRNITEREAFFSQYNVDNEIVTGVNPEQSTMRTQEEDPETGYDPTKGAIDVPSQSAPVLGMASEGRTPASISSQIQELLAAEESRPLTEFEQRRLDSLLERRQAALLEAYNAQQTAKDTPTSNRITLEEGFVIDRDEVEAMFSEWSNSDLKEFLDNPYNIFENTPLEDRFTVPGMDADDPSMRDMQASIAERLASAVYATRPNRTGKVLPFRKQDAESAQAPILGMAAVDANAEDFDATDSPAFRRWFGDSQTVDRRGEPVVYYHGTPHYFNAFRPNELGLIFASPEQSFAEAFAGLDPSTLDHRPAIPLYVRAENMWDYENPAHIDTILANPEVATLVDNYYAREGLTPEESREKLAQGDWSMIEEPTVIAAIKAAGFDALTVFEPNAKNIAVFEPNQLKHATDNKGAWSRQDDSIFGMATESDSPAKEERARVTNVAITGAFRNDKGLGENVLNLVELAKSSPAYDTMAAESLVRNYQDALDAMARERGIPVRDLSREIFDKLEKAASETDSYSDNKAAWANVLSEYGHAGEVLMDMRNRTDALSIEALRLRREQGGDFSPEDLRAHKAIAANLGRYVHRMYAAGSGKAGRKYGQAMWDAYMKNRAAENPDKELSLLERQNAAVVERAMKVLADDLRIPDDASLVEMDRPDLEKLYHTWLNTASVGLAMDTMIDRLIDARDRLNGDTNQLNNHVERAAKDLLNLLKGNVTTPIGVFYRGNKIDRGILKEKKSIAPAIRELMGEIRDPGVALLGSIAKTSEFVARSRLMLDLRKLEGRDLQPPNAGGSDLVAQGNLQPLKGPDYGALEGWYASPNMEAMLKETVEHVASLEQALTNMGSNPEMISKKLLMKAADKWMKGAGYTKAASILGNPVNFGINFAGSFDTMLQNGNFTSPETQLRALNDAWHLVKYAADPSQSTEAIRLLAKYDVIDSARIGELKNMNYKQLQTYIKSLTKEGGRKRGKIMAFGRGYKETYAMADVWAKIANFHQNVNDLTAYNNAEGLGWTQDEIYSRASAATKRTNFTYSRTAPFIRVLERGGITMFGTYFYETYRTQVENIVEVGRDLKMGNDAKTAEGKQIGYTRAAKRLTGIVASNSFKYFAAQALAKAMFGDDEEKWYNIRGLLPDFMDNQDFIPIGRDKNGKWVMFPISRIDPYGPATDILREIMHGNGDPSAVVEQLIDLYIAPRVGGAIIKEAFNEGRKPTTQIVAEDAYGGTVNAVARIPGMDGGSAARVVKLFANIGETALPGIVNSWRENNVRPVGTDLPSQMAAYSTYAGVRLYNLDPNMRMQSAGFDYKEFESDTRTQIKDYFKSQVSPSVDVVEDMVLGIAADEKKEWDKLRRIYLGMQDIGMTPDEAKKVMKDSPIPAGVRNSVISGSFVPTAVSVKSIKSHRDNLLKGKDKEEQAKIKERWDNMVEILEGVLSE